MRAHGVVDLMVVALLPINVVHPLLHGIDECILAFNCVTFRKKLMQMSYHLIVVMVCNLAIRITSVTKCMWETFCRFILLQ
jgi:hypothetical protein